MDPLVCYCFCVSEESVRTAIRVQRLRTVLEVVEATNAGMGCRGCWFDIEEMLEQYWSSPEAEADAAADIQAAATKAADAQAAAETKAAATAKAAETKAADAAKATDGAARKATTRHPQHGDGDKAVDPRSTD